MRTVDIVTGGFRFVPVLYLADALTEAIDDREVFMKGVDASYAYEGYESYGAFEL